MKRNDRFEWTEEERRLFEALPRERDPGPALRRQVLDALRRRGRPHRSRKRWRRPLLGAAAAIVVFAAGVAVGLSLDPGPGARPLAETDSLGDPVRIQHLGTAYATAIASVAARDGEEIPPEARKVALNTLRGAAEQLASLPGHEPEVRGLLLSIRDLSGGDVDDSATLERWF
ncbi:MAG: hypothetical protein R3199_03435 [Gemmatimonadota bacterium]|nr:hypothetical protein [Gemmatimonadota bacterium]